MAIPQYNTITYDTAQYDASTSFFSTTLTETQASTDVKNSNDQTTKTEAVTGVDALTQLVQQAARTETITQSESRTLQSFINQLDSSTTSDLISNLINLAKIDTATLSDALTQSAIHILSDSETLTDAIAKTFTNIRLDAITPSEATPQSSGQYGVVRYDAVTYNQQRLVGFEVQASIAKAESFVLVAALATVVSYLRSFPDTVNVTDLLQKSFAIPAFNEFLFSFDALEKRVSGKTFTESVPVNAWLRSYKSIPADVWNDEDE